MCHGSVVKPSFPFLPPHPSVPADGVVLPVPPYPLLPGVVGRDALALSSRAGTKKCKKLFQTLALASLPSVISGFPKEGICKPMPLSFTQQHCKPLYLPPMSSVLTGQGLRQASDIAQPVWAWLEVPGLHRLILLIQKKWVTGDIPQGIR